MTEPISVVVIALTTEGATVTEPNTNDGATLAAIALTADGETASEPRTGLGRPRIARERTHNQPPPPLPEHGAIMSQQERLPTYDRGHSYDWNYNHAPAAPPPIDEPAVPARTDREEQR